jgi:hypothetical protein
MAYDGAGLVAKQTDTRQVDSNAPSSSSTYFLHSTVLGGRVVTEYDSSVVRQHSYVYAEGEIIAEQRRNGDGSMPLLWLQTNPVVGDQVATDSAGKVGSRTVLDPMGTDVGDSDPFATNTDTDPGTVGSGGEGVSQSSVDARVAQLIPGYGGAQCTIDLMSASCGLVDAMLSSGGGKRCANNYCGPRVYFSSLTIGGITRSESVWTSSYRAYDGPGGSERGGVWVNGIGSPDVFEPDPVGGHWRSNTGGSLVEPGYSYRLTGSQALAVGVAYYGRSFAPGVQNSRDERPTISYEEWIRIQDKIDTILFKYGSPFLGKRISQEDIERLKELIRRREGRRILPPKPTPQYLKRVDDWNKCSAPLVDAYNEYVNDLNEDKFLEAMGKSVNAIAIEQPNGNPEEAMRSVFHVQADSLFEKAVAIRRAGIVLDRTIKHTCGNQP